MDNTLRNFATATGTYNLIPTTLTSEAIITQVVDNLTIIKAADKSVWTDGLLTYTVTITNTAAYDFENPIFKDTLDVTLVSLVDDSVLVDDVVTAYTYDEQTGELSVNLATIEVGDTVVITFQVAKK